MTTDVSIVIPTFNRADRVQRAIDSALAQTVACEVVVSDHGSTDHTPEVVGRYGDRVRYLRRDKDNGPEFAWLDGVINANGEYIHITYDDDWIEPEFVEKCLALMIPSCAYVLTGAWIHRDRGGRQWFYRDVFESGLHGAKKMERWLLGLRGTVSPGCGLFRRRDALQALRIEPRPYAGARYHGVGADLLMYLLPLLEYERFGFVNEPLANFTAHDGSITIDASQEKEKETQLITAYDDVKRYYLILRYSKHGKTATKTLERYRRRRYPYGVTIKCWVVETFPLLWRLVRGPYRAVRSVYRKVAQIFTGGLRA